jgi:hypothetical protein
VVTPRNGSGDDSPWRRPAIVPPGGPTPAPTQQTNGSGYKGPPPTNPPPAGWRPPIVAQPSAPRTLPEQDHARLDVAERAAKTLTVGVGMLVAAILLVLMLILCARGLF